MQCCIIDKNHSDIRCDTAEKCSCTSWPPKGNEEEGLPKTAANVTLKIMENAQTKASNEKRSQCESGDSLMTAIVGEEDTLFCPIIYHSVAKQSFGDCVLLTLCKH